MKKLEIIKFIDLFAGLGGTRIGFELASKKLGLKSNCVFTSEIKQSAIETYKENFPNSEINGDITQININSIPNFDFLLGGFPCQPFSSAGKRRGFFDTRGTLFFNIEEILKIKKPKGFLLENVEGLANHDNGNTLKIIINNLEKLNYNVNYQVIDSSKHGVAQKRIRTYIVGHLNKKISLNNLTTEVVFIKDLLESNKKLLNTNFTKNLLKHYKPTDLYGKSIKDKRGGKNNIHSWDIELKGTVNTNQRYLLNSILKERRKKHWATKKGIKWMDGMPLTLTEIDSFTNNLLFKIDLKKELDDLVEKGYLKFEHPKKQIKKEMNKGTVTERVYDNNIEKGYNIVTGKLSFEFSKILDPNSVAPTLVATDANKLGVVDGNGVRKLTVREGLRLFGFPENYKINQTNSKAFDLLGNSVAVPVIQKLIERLLT